MLPDAPIEAEVEPGLFGPGGILSQAGPDQAGQQWSEQPVAFGGCEVVAPPGHDAPDDGRYGLGLHAVGFAGQPGCGLHGGQSAVPFRVAALGELDDFEHLLRQGGQVSQFFQQDFLPVDLCCFRLR